MGLLDFLKEVACDMGFHSWGDWLYLKKGDCTQVKQCVRPLCVKIKDDTQIVHDFGKWRYRKAKSCGQTCTCRRCRETEKRTLHPWTAWKYRKKGSCLQVRSCPRCRADEKRTQHVGDWRYAAPKSCTQIFICVRCSHKKVRAVKKREDHAQWGEWGYDPDLRSCSAQARFCLRCGEKQTRLVIPNHDYSDWEYISPTRRKKRCRHCHHVEWQRLEGNRG